MIETGVTILERMGGVETRFRIGDGQTVSHAIGVVDVVSRWTVTNITFAQVDRTPRRAISPNSSLRLATDTTMEYGLRTTRNMETLILGVEDTTIAAILVTHGLVVIDVLVVKRSQSVLRLACLHQLQQLSKSVSSLFATINIVFIGQVTGTYPGTTLHQGTCRPEIHLTQVTQGHDLVDTPVVMA